MVSRQREDRLMLRACAEHHAGQRLTHSAGQPVEHARWRCPDPTRPDPTRSRDRSAPGLRQLAVARFFLIRRPYQETDGPLVMQLLSARASARCAAICRASSTTTDPKETPTMQIVCPVCLHVSTLPGPDVETVDEVCDSCNAAIDDDAIDTLYDAIGATR